MEARQPFSAWAGPCSPDGRHAGGPVGCAASGAARPGLLGEPVFLWAASVLGAYGLGIPAACLVLWGRRPRPPGPPPAGAGPLQALWAGSVGLAYLANGATLLLTGLLGRLRGRGGGQPGGVHRPYPSAPAPAGRAHRPCGGGLLFRLLLRRLRPMGSALRCGLRLCFSLFHGNLNQFFMPFFWGWCWRAGALHRLPGRPSSSTRWSTSFPSSGAGWAARWW